MRGWNKWPASVAWVSWADSHVVFFHIPKTGGTTLEYLLVKNYRVDSLQHINAPELDANPYRACRNGKLVRVLMGHYELNDVFYQWFNRRVAHITMLREPVRRALSYYDYIQTSHQHPLYPVAKDMSLEDFVSSDRIDEQNNAQTHRLLGWLRQGAHRRIEADEEERFRLAKRTLEKRFTLVGTTEDYEAFLLMAQSLLRWPDIYYVRKNVSRKKTRLVDVPKSTIDLIRERNALDLRVWRFARSLARRRCEGAGNRRGGCRGFPRTEPPPRRPLDPRRPVSFARPPWRTRDAMGLRHVVVEQLPHYVGKVRWLFADAYRYFPGRIRAVIALDALGVLAGGLWLAGLLVFVDALERPDSVASRWPWLPDVSTLPTIAVVAGIHGAGFDLGRRASTFAQWRWREFASTIKKGRRSGS